MNDLLNEGFKELLDSHSSAGSVREAATATDNCDLFNAGKGSILTAKSEHETDATVMDRKTLKAGAVAVLRDLRNPVQT